MTIQLLLRWFVLFSLFACLGWLCETLFCSLPAGHLTNNALLHGPFSPVYGIGALCTIAASRFFSQNLLSLFFASMAVNCAVEYCTGLLLETVCRRRFWDYSRRRFHLHGRVCLGNGLLFGLMGVLTVRVLFPLLWPFLEGLSLPVLLPLSAALGGYFLIDLFYTLARYRRHPA